MFRASVCGASPRPHFVTGHHRACAQGREALTSSSLGHVPYPHPRQKIPSATLSVSGELGGPACCLLYPSLWQASGPSPASRGQGRGRGEGRRRATLGLGWMVPLESSDPSLFDSLAPFHSLQAVLLWPGACRWDLGSRAWSSLTEPSRGHLPGVAG